LREQIYEAVMLHEIGHTLGLRHNFSGSADALNYFAEYWPLREETLNPAPRTTGDLLRQTCEIEDASNRDGCAAQRDGRMGEYAYSTVMDYGARFNSDIHGVGHYDRAAIAAGYGDLVEVFTPAAEAQVQDRAFVEAMAGIRVPLAGSIGEYTHYTTLPALFGGSQNFEQRELIPRSHYTNSQGSGAPRLRVPYLACYEEYVDATALCHRWDAGADPYEISMDYVTRYREYYPLVNLQRDRVNFSSAAVGDRMTSRFFLPLANMYQHWLFSAFNGGSGDGVLDTYAEIGMQRGFSLLWEVMSTPRYGSYRLASDASGQSYYDFLGYDPQASASLYLPPGQGRRQFSRYDSSAGYNFFQRTVEAGYFYEQIGALIALTANDASVLGVGADVNADRLTYSIPYYLAFQEEIDSLFSGLISEDFQAYAPYVVDGQVVPKDLWTESLAPAPADAPRLEVTAPFTTQLYAMLYGAALLSSNFDTSFLNKLQVGVVGESETITPAADFEEVRATDPFSGRTYAAYRKVGGDPGSSFVAAKIVERVQQRADDYAAAVDGSDEQLQLGAQIRNDVQTLEIMRGLYAQYKNVI
jgi:Met-zincin